MTTLRRLYRIFSLHWLRARSRSSVGTCLLLGLLSVLFGLPAHAAAPIRAAAVTVLTPTIFAPGDTIADFNFFSCCLSPAQVEYSNEGGKVVGVAGTQFGVNRVKALPPVGWTVAAFSLFSDSIVVTAPPRPPCSDPPCEGPPAALFPMQLVFSHSGTLNANTANPSSEASVLVRYKEIPPLGTSETPTPWDASQPDFFALSIAGEQLRAGGLPTTASSMSVCTTCTVPSATISEIFILSVFGVYGQPTTFQMLLEAKAIDGGVADFSNSLILTNIFIPLGATLSSESGAQYSVTNVPEPSTWVLFIGGGLFVMMWRRRQMTVKGSDIGGGLQLGVA